VSPLPQLKAKTDSFLEISGTFPVEGLEHHSGQTKVLLSEEISKHQQLKKKFDATALNTVLASAHTQTTQQ
jgi:hypothetical protein